MLRGIDKVKLTVVIPSAVILSVILQNVAAPLSLSPML
jgi:hypothetical protein